jgi:hypothetical protein
MKITKKDYLRFEKEILAGARPGATMNEADPLGVMLQKKVAQRLKEMEGAANA